MGRVTTAEFLPEAMMLQLSVISHKLLRKKFLSLRMRVRKA